VNASRVLRDMDEAVRREGDGKIPIPFPGDAKEALTLLECLYLQERPLSMAEVSGLARLSHEWNIPGITNKCDLFLTSAHDQQGNDRLMLALPAFPQATPTSEGEAAWDCFDWAILACSCELPLFAQKCETFISNNPQVLSDPRLEQLNRESLVRILRAFKGSNVLDFRGINCPECKGRNVTGRLTLVGSGTYDVSFVCNRIGCYRTFFSERNIKNLQSSDAHALRPGSAGSSTMYS